jgi:hypothetical protein
MAERCGRERDSLTRHHRPGAGESSCVIRLQIRIGVDDSDVIGPRPSTDAAIWR